eukprot:3720665-Alexandrium_andersonii.AAC.1
MAWNPPTAGSLRCKCSVLSAPRFARCPQGRVLKLGVPSFCLIFRPWRGALDPLARLRPQLGLAGHWCLTQFLSAGSI